MPRGRVGHEGAFQANGIITFTSDFGTCDSYVAEVKGAILCVAPDARVVDVTHEVPPQDVRTGAFLLMRAVTAFPAGTVHLAVVDPGVGTSRRAAVARTGTGHVLVGPDNGLLSWAAGPRGTWWEWARLDLVPTPRSRTFHGRDLFGPAAAALAAGRVTPEECGSAIPEPVVLPWPRARRLRGGCCGEVLVVDRFGNVIVAIPGDWVRLPDGASVRVEAAGQAHEAVAGPYASGASLVVHEDSSGWTEVAVPGGRADERLGVGPGAEVTLRWRWGNRK